MNIKEYFKEHNGTGVLSTADDNGRVNSAIYAKPHFLEDGSLAFIMRDRLTRYNLTLNPSASYLFIEKGDGYHGVRIHLEKIKESSDQTMIDSLSRRTYAADEKAENRYLVTFKIQKVLTLIGSNEPNED
jgi:hypothetical protein